MVLVVFLVVYAGMILGGVPRLPVDRTGVALLGAIALMLSGVVSLDAAVGYLDVPTLALLFSMMVLSAQLRLGGFYSALTHRLARSPLSAPLLLASVIGITGLLAAVFTNDIVALTVAPVLLYACQQKKLNPIPFLLALACAVNVGSATTLIGNPQNMLIGQVLHLSFAHYTLVAFLPSLLGLGIVWFVIARRYHTALSTPAPLVDATYLPETYPFDAWQTTKGLLLALLLLFFFLFTDFPRELTALACAATVLLNRTFHTREMLGLVDWELLVLFAGLFIVNGAMLDSGLTQQGLEQLAALGISLRHPAWLFGLTVVLSNTVSNVPAVMLLLPTTDASLGGPVLALASTLAGNLLIVGSIANIIVVDQAARRAILITGREHARVGIPVTLLTLALAAATLWLFAP